MNPPHSLVLDVTEDDIRRGQPRQSRGCPLALACERLYPRWIAVVTNTEVGLIPRRAADGDSARYPLPPEAVAFVGQFDRFTGIHHGLAPTVFTLGLDQSS